MDFLKKRDLMERNSYLFEMFTEQHPQKTYEIADSQRFVLRQIALTEKKQSKYQIEQAIDEWLLEHFPKRTDRKGRKIEGTRISHGAVYSAILQLEKDGAIVGKEKRKYFGRPMYEYSLTYFGVCLAILQLSYYPVEPKDRDRIGKIAEIWKYVDPVLLGKWKYLQQKFGKNMSNSYLLYVAHLGTSNLVLPNPQSGEAEEYLELEEFREFAVSMLIDYISYMRDQYNGSKDSQEELEAFFRHYGVKNNVDFDPDKALDVWLGVFREDPDLKKYLDSYIDYVFKCVEAGIEWGNFLKGKMMEDSESKIY